MPQFPKFFNAIEKRAPKLLPAPLRRAEASETSDMNGRYDLEYPDGPGTRPVATGMHACIGKDSVHKTCRTGVAGELLTAASRSLFPFQNRYC